jgi:hypothetical protein
VKPCELNHKVLSNTNIYFKLKKGFLVSDFYSRLRY